MLSRDATVVAVEKDHVVMELTGSPVCARCVATRGCSQSLLCLKANRRQLRVPVSTPGLSQARRGDRVFLELADRKALTMSLWVFAGPMLIGALLVSLLALTLPLGEGAIIASAGVVFPALFYLGIRRYLRSTKPENLLPVVRLAKSAIHPTGARG